MEYALSSYKNLLKNLKSNDVPTDIDMFYDLSYQLSTYIFDYRISQNLTQKNFAAMLDVKQSMISKLESGNYNISLESICSIMAKLNTKIELNLKPYKTLKASTCDKTNLGDSDNSLTVPVSLEEAVGLVEAA